MATQKTLLARNWFAFLALVSTVLLLITAASYAFEGAGAVSTFMFFVGLGGENNVGAWWSGMLLLLGAVLALDGYCNAAKPRAERRGWAALSLALALLSFDEVASLHEYVADIGLRYLAPFALIGFGLVAYALVGLRRGGARTGTLARIVIAFCLLATVPLQEYVQHNVEWQSGLMYGIRALIEEGTEITAMLMLIAVAAPNGAALLRNAGDIFVVTARYRASALLAGALLVPMLAAATLVLPYPPGPANWLMQTFFLGATLLVARRWASGAQDMNVRTALLFMLYLAGGAASAVSLRWDPEVLGSAVSLRGVCCAVLLVAAVPILRAAGRTASAASAASFGVLAALVLLAAVTWPGSVLVWSALPAFTAVWLYAAEGGSFSVVSGAVERKPPAASPVTP